jgi:hypothetical protein
MEALMVAIFGAIVALFASGNGPRRQLWECLEAQDLDRRMSKWEHELMEFSRGDAYDIFAMVVAVVLAYFLVALAGDVGADGSLNFKGRVAFGSVIAVLLVQLVRLAVVLRFLRLYCRHGVT